MPGSAVLPGLAGMRVSASQAPWFRLPDVRLRPLRRGDTDTVKRVFTALSPESRRMRFLSATPRLTTGALHHLADVDHDTHGCWVATVGRTPVGLGRYSRLPDEPDAAEVALEVADEVQGRGLGKLLLATVAVAAADAGVRSLVWLMYPANERVRHLGREGGARFRTHQGAVEGRVDIPAFGGPYAADVVRVARVARQAATAARQARVA